MANLVSVIIPVRNEARGIAAVVHAVQAQHHPGWDLEVLVVDDGSIDGTAETAQAAGARVLELESGVEGGNPAR
ncbi:MAG TPA: glycosyltransferase, partial [Gemmatimonadales bacterium]